MPICKKYLQNRGDIGEKLCYNRDNFEERKFDGLNPSYLVEFDATMRRRLLLGFVWRFLLLTLLYSVVCTPIQLWLTSDILLQNTVLPTVMDLLMSVLNFAFYWIVFAYLLYSVARFHPRTGGIFMAIFAGLGFLRYAIAQAMAYWILHDVFLWTHVRDLALYVLFDCLMAGAVLWLVTYKDRQTIRDGGLLAQIPLTRLFDFKKSISLLIAISAAIPSAIHLITRLIYDFSALGGLPTSFFDLIWVLVGYLSELVFALVGYMVIVMLVNSCFMREAKAKLNFENTTL